MTDKEKLEKLKKLADAMYYAAQYLTTDASKLHKAMDEYHNFVTTEYHKEDRTIPDIVDEHFDEMLGEESVSKETMTDWFKHCKKSWYNEGYIKSKHKAIEWIKEVDSHNYIMRYCDSCEPTVNELIEWFDNFMEDEQ